MEVNPSEHNSPQESTAPSPNSNNQDIENQKSSESSPRPATAASSSSSGIDNSLQQDAPEQDPATIPHEESNSATRTRTILPGYRTHRGWQASGVSMAKCDICNQRTRGTVQKCDDCQLSICYTCCVAGRLDSRHTLDPDSVRWDVHIKSREQRKKPSRVANPRRGRGRGRGGRARGRGGRGISTPSADSAIPSRAESLLDEPLEDSIVLGLPQPPYSTVDTPIQSHHDDTVLIGDSLYHRSPCPTARPEQLQHISTQLPQDYTHDTPSLYQRAPSGMTRLVNSPQSDRGSIRWAPYSTQAPQRGHTRPYETHTRDQGLPANSGLAMGLPAFREPSPYVGPPVSFDTYRQNSVPPQYPQPTYNRPTPQPQSQPPTVNRCPIFEDLRNDLVARVRIALEDFPGAGLDACLRAVISRAWSRSKFKHLRGINEEWAFKTLIGVANATFLHLGAPLDNAGRQWLRELENQLVEANLIRPLRYSFASSSSEVS